MDDYFVQIERAVQANLYYLALGTTLIVPDVCAALAAKSGKSNSRRYSNWFNQEMGAEYGQCLSGRDCWELRCKYLHQGRARHGGKQHKRLIFLEPKPGPRNIIHKSIFNDALVLDVPIFCNDMVVAARQWLAANEGNRCVQANLAASIKRHPYGLAPYITGIPVIG